MCVCVCAFFTFSEGHRINEYVLCSFWQFDKQIFAQRIFENIYFLFFFSHESRFDLHRLMRPFHFVRFQTTTKKTKKWKKKKRKKEKRKQIHIYLNIQIHAYVGHCTLHMQMHEIQQSVFKFVLVYRSMSLHMNVPYASNQNTDNGYLIIFFTVYSGFSVKRATYFSATLIRTIFWFCSHTFHSSSSSVFLLQIPNFSIQQTKRSSEQTEWSNTRKF